MKFSVKETLALVSALLCYFVLPLIVTVPVMMFALFQNGPVIDSEAMAIPEWTFTIVMVVSFIFLVILAAVLLLLYRRFLIDEWKKLVAHPKRFVLFAVIGSVIFIGVGYIIALFIPQDGTNQSLIEDMNQKMPWLIGIQAVILAPFVEELLFRKVLYLHVKGSGQLSVDAIKQKQSAKGGALIRIIAMMIASSLLFGLMHFGFGTDPWFMIIPYFTMGLMLVISYELSDMIYVPMTIHFVNNLISVILMLLLQ